jgi:hypothetical protein
LRPCLNVCRSLPRPRQCKKIALYFKIMGKDPAVLFYTSDFLTGTSRLTDEQCGQYIRALCSQHQEGLFSKEELFAILKSYDSPVWKKFEKDENGFFYNERMKFEIEKRVSYCESKSHKGIAGRKKESYDNHTISDRKSYGNHTENENENDNRIKDKDIIEKLYSLYPTRDINNNERRTGKCEKNKNQIKALLKLGKSAWFIEKTIEIYLKNCNETKAYKKDFGTFLNNLPDFGIPNEQPTEEAKNVIP